MKVLHLTTHLNSGGITNYILSLIKPLRELDCEISVLSGGGEMVPAFLEQATPMYQLPIKTKSELNPKIYWALPKIIQTIRENKIDLLHAHTRVTMVMAYWIQRKIGIPVVTTCHGFYKRRLGRRLIPAWGDLAIAISHPVGDHLKRDFKVPPIKIRIINNGVNLLEIDSIYHTIDCREEKRKFGFLETDMVVGVVARLVMDKGHEYLIRAMAELIKMFPNIRLLIVGDGNYRHHLENLVAELRIGPYVVFTGNLSSRDVVRALGATDIFALPATWREGFGLSIVEAMACCKPVIVTNIWALNALVQNDKTGILIEPKQVAPLIESISRLVMDSEARLRIGKSAREMTEKFFSIPRMAEEIKQAYGELVIQKNPDGSPKTTLTPSLTRL